ncbi:hypothetical protein F2Q69_00005313 [Brassica cretica]|uniref:Calreticulin n=1 Tax=Brassica cretica TaxID=69181 RepID=A0A8S9P388_BRACR|nr:hypothetical protein F2Q69_00005313 [Brassica cretica]
MTSFPHVYTAILVDGEEKKNANLLSGEDFEPALIPDKDKKPEDWDKRAKIPDPNAVKPDDWDEDAPMEIEAEEPEGWLDDPEATKPEDWDDEDDVMWRLTTPKCETAPG